ncbi:ATP-dependent DNA helicase PIF1 [Ilyonectria robusta]
MLTEQVRAVGDLELQRLLTRIQQGEQDESDIELLNTFQRNEQKPVRIFLFEHRWGKPNILPVMEEEATFIASVGDDSRVYVLATFMFVPGMPVVVTMNINPGLKLVNSAKYTALEVIPDSKRFPGCQLAPNIILHFGLPAGIILSSESTKKFEFDEIPPGTMMRKDGS